MMRNVSIPELAGFVFAIIPTIIKENEGIMFPKEYNSSAILQ